MPWRPLSWTPCHLFDARASSVSRRAVALSVGITALLTQACATENVSEVVIASVSIRPANAALEEGDTLELDAVVTDDAGMPLSGTSVEWSSDAPDVVFVDGTGLAMALSDGVATVEASFRGVSGAATVIVLPGPSIELSPNAVDLVGAAGGRAPPPERVRIENGGLGALTHLGADVQYEPGAPRGWLGVELDSTTTPTTLTLTSVGTELSAGVYDATVVVASEDPSVDDAALPVRLTLAGFTLTETDGGTVVHESGTTDTFTAVLDLEPVADVTLLVTSMDSQEVVVSPSTLTFTRSDWSTPRSVTVTGEDDETVDGDRVTLVNVSVAADSGTAYGVVEDQDIEVMVLDDDVADFILAETGVGTVAREGGTPDTITVVLTARPLTDVVFTVSSDDESDATVSPTRLTFTPLDWDVPRSVAFTAVDDGMLDGTRRRTLTVTVDDAASDAAFHGLSKTVEAFTLDNWRIW